MRTPSADRCSGAPCLPPPAPLNLAYAELLRAHEHARQRGQPLLTEAGISYLRQRLRLAELGRAVQANTTPGPNLLPCWDPQGRGLWLGGQLLKKFRQPAQHQTALLDVFQEQGWGAAHIDDPLPLAAGEGEEDAKRRLHETLKNLNRSLPPGTIRFRGDGTGQGVVWEYDLRRPARARRPPR